MGSKMVSVKIHSFALMTFLYFTDLMKPFLMQVYLNDLKVSHWKWKLLQVSFKYFLRKLHV
jgi:hypothetical protein